MADELSELGEELPELGIVRTFLEEHDLDAEQVLAVLAAALVRRHMDIELRKLGKKPPYTPGNERKNALVAAMDALFQASGLGPGENPKEGELNISNLLFHLLGQCQFAAEERAGISGDDDEPPSYMRLVTD
jgi:hypothetical protein